jgi:hypothetical protein
MSHFHYSIATDLSKRNFSRDVKGLIMYNVSRFRRDLLETVPHLLIGWKEEEYRIILTERNGVRAVREIINERLQAGDIVVVESTRLPNIPCDLLPIVSALNRCPHFNKETIHSIVSEGAVVESISEVKDESVKVSRAFIFIKDGKVVTGVTRDNQLLLPTKVLSDNGKVELRGEYILTYKTPSQEYKTKVLADVKERDDRISHCKKLLHDLPIALKRSEVASNEVSANTELVELGAFLVEQRIIKQGIEDQKKLLPILQSSIIPQPDPFHCEDFEGKYVINFGWGSNTYNGVTYRMLRNALTIHSCTTNDFLVQVSPPSRKRESNEKQLESNKKQNINNSVSLSSSSSSSPRPVSTFFSKVIGLSSEN